METQKDNNDYTRRNRFTGESIELTKEEAEKYANILGYNYNSSEWFEKSYKILNKNYQFKKNTKSEKLTEDKGFIDKILKKIR